jgi:neopullulanase
MGSASTEILGYEAWWDLPALPKIDLGHPQAREYILGVAESWIHFGIDGWRLDVAEEVEADFWREFHGRVRAANPEAYIVGEVWAHKPDWLAGDMFDAFMNYPLTRAILGFAAQEHWDTSLRVPTGYEGEGAVVPLDGDELWARIEELDRLNDPAVTAVQLNLLGSHDTPRVLTLCGGDLDSVRLAALLQMTLPGAPCIYYGDEIGMAGTMDPMCRGAFPEDPAEWDRAPYEWMADLIALRHSSRAFRDAELTLLGTAGAGIAYLRRDGDEVYVVVANADRGALIWDVPLPMDVSEVELLPLCGGASGERTAGIVGRVLRLSLPGRDGVVLRLSL